MKTPTSYTAQKYAAFAQVYRWTLVYEATQTDMRIQNTLRALTDDFVLHNVDGTWKGKEKYRERLGLMRAWENTHHIKKLRFKQEGGEILVTTESFFQMVFPGDVKDNYDVNFFIVLQKLQGDLPLIREVTVKPVLSPNKAEFKRSYYHNRAMSFIYYWLYHLEKYRNDAGRIRPLFADDYDIEFGSKKVFKTVQHIADWMYHHYSELGYSNFNTRNFKAEKLKDGRIHVVVEMTNKDKSSSARYEIVLEDNPDEPFAAIKKMTMLEAVAAV